MTNEHRSCVLLYSLLERLTEQTNALIEEKIKNVVKNIHFHNVWRPEQKCKLRLIFHIIDDKNSPAMLNLSLAFMAFLYR